MTYHTGTVSGSPLARSSTALRCPAYRPERTIIKGRCIAAPLSSTVYLSPPHSITVSQCRPLDLSSASPPTVKATVLPSVPSLMAVLRYDSCAPFRDRPPDQSHWQGLELSAADIQVQLSRRRPGQSNLTTPASIQTSLYPLVSRSINREMKKTWSKSNLESSMGLLSEHLLGSLSKMRINAQRTIPKQTSTPALVTQTTLTSKNTASRQAVEVAVAVLVRPSVNRILRRPRFHSSHLNRTCCCRCHCRKVPEVSLRH